MAVELAEKLRRVRAGRSYADVAREVGCSPGNIRKIEAEASRPGFDLGMRLARALGVPAEWLADDEADWPPPASEEGQAVELVRGALTKAGIAGDLTDEERELLAGFRQLAPAQQRELLGYLRGLAAGGSSRGAAMAADLERRLLQRGGNDGTEPPSGP